MKKKVLIIGGCGYIGSELTRFLKEDHDVSTTDLEWFGNFNIGKKNRKRINNMNDICDLKVEYVSQFRYVILLAAHSSVKMCKDNSESSLKNNVLNFVKILNMINKNQIFIYASSSSVYGDTKKKVVDEKYSNFEPNNYYDLSKHEIDSYAKLSDKTYYGLRFGTVNGASPNFRNDIMINAMTYNAIKNGKVFCFNPSIYRPILGIKDLCRAIGFILKKGTSKTSGIYNLASFNSTARQISNKVAKTLNVKMEVIKEIPKNITNVKLQTKAYNFSISSKKFEETFDFEFEETVESIVTSIAEEYDNMNMDNRSNAKIY